MDQDQLPKAMIERTELEYLFDDNQWLPAIISRYQPGSSHEPYVTIQLLQHPREHSGALHPSTDDIKNRLRLKSGNMTL
jgi:hypothetical protein